MRGILVLWFALFALALAPAAAAAPPANDDFDNSTIITALPFSDSVDTTEATVAADDPTSACFAETPVFTLWYSFTPPTSTRLERPLSFSGSTPAGMSVYTGSRGNLSEVLCGPTGIQQFDVVGGTTYFFMIWGFGAGVVQFDLAEILPPPSITLSIDSTGSVAAKTGVATVRGTVTCSRSVVLPELQISLSQLFAHRVTIHALVALQDFPCSSSGSRWSVAMQGDNGLFAAGSATASASTFFCNQSGECTTADTSRTIRLRGK
jgi:hypothetical protein